MSRNNKIPTPTPRKLFCGAFQPDLETTLAQEIAAIKTACGSLAPVTVVVPTRLLGLHLQRTLARQLTGHANLRFQSLTELLPGNQPSPLALELLCRQLAQTCDGYFAPVRDTPGFATALLATFTDLRESGLATLPGKTTKHRELAAAYQKFCEWLKPRTPNPLPQPQVFLYGFYDLNFVQRQFIQRLAPTAIFFPVTTHDDYAKPLLDWFVATGYQPVTFPSSNLQSQITVISAPGETAEVREAVRAIFAYLRANPSKTFADCAILCRQRNQYDAILRDTLPALGVRAFFRGGRPLCEHPDAKRFLLLLETIRSDFSRSAVMELAGQISATGDWDALTIKLGIVGGKLQWRDRLRRATEQTGELTDFVEELFTATDALPRQGSWQQFVDVIIPAFRKLGGRHAPVIGAIEALTELDAVQTPVSFETFAEFTGKTLVAGREQPEKFQDGGIFVSDVMGARGLSFGFVAVLGLVEKSFPRIIREDPLLLDEERAKISADLPLKRRGHDEERLLFDLAIAAAREQLVLSYPRLDTGSARPRLPSCLLRPFNLKPHLIPLVKLAHGDDALDTREFDLTLLQTKRLPVALLAEMSPHLARGLPAEQLRWGELKLTPHDGLAPAAGVALAELVVAPTQLETFAFCPFKYFCKQTLNLKRWEEPEHIWSADPSEIGSAVHDILETFYKQAALPLQLKLRETYRRQLRDLARQRLDEFERDGVTGLPVVWSLRRTALVRDLLKFLDLEIARADDLVPREFEKAFGPTTLHLAPTLTLAVRGRMDRVDVAGNRARILDYKTGKAYHKKDDAFDGGEALQLPLYALAAERAFGLSVVASEYAYISGGRYVRFTGEALKNRAGELTLILETFSAMLRAGEFPQYTGHNKCGWCDYRPICGNAIERLAARKLADERLAPFRVVKEIK
ncbi:MAG: PD-(D/E)XK nuclease family protein [Verrucomicrobiota bacterium]